MGTTPFDEGRPRRQRINPFTDEEQPSTFDDDLTRIDHAAGAVRRLKARLGAEGLTNSATRELLVELSLALDSVGSALRELSRKLD